VVSEVADVVPKTLAFTAWSRLVPVLTEHCRSIVENLLGLRLDPRGHLTPKRQRRLAPR